MLLIVIEVLFLFSCGLFCVFIRDNLDISPFSAYVVACRE